MKRSVNILLVTGICLLFSTKVSAAPSANQTSPQLIDHPSVSVDLTSVVVAALTLGFGYGVLKTFQGGK